MSQSLATYSGTASALFGAEGELRRGCRPSAFLLYLNTGNHALTSGNLVFSESMTGASFTLVDCVPDGGYFQEPHDPYAKGAMRVVKARVLDRRYKWWQQESDGEFNRRNLDGSLDESTKKTCKELVEHLLDQMGESGADTAAVTAAAYPYVKFKGPPAEALENVLLRCGYDLVLRANNTVQIVQVGTGSDVAGTGSVLDPPSGVALDMPAEVKVVCGPTIWQSLFLCEAIGVEADASVDDLDGLSYKPSPDGWMGEWPQFFVGVAPASRHLAFISVYRWYRAFSLAAGAGDGTWTPTGASESGTAMHQMLPWLACRAESGEIQVDLLRPGDIQVKGSWWPWSDVADNTAAFSNFIDSFRVDAGNGLVKFDHPMFKLTGGCPDAADVYVLAAHRFRLEDGSYDRKDFSQALSGGGGTLEIPFPELFVAKVQQYTSSGTPSSTADNETAIQTEATALLSSWAQVLSGTVPQRKRQGIGIQAIECSGTISGVHWSAGRNRVGRTVVTVGSAKMPRGALPLGWQSMGRLDENQ